MEVRGLEWSRETQERRVEAASSSNYLERQNNRQPTPADLWAT